MMGRGIRYLVLATGLLLSGVSAHAENRLALVIGQSAYRSAPALPNPANDARAMTDLLRRAGFDVTTAGDLTQLDMRQTIADFTGKIAARGPDTVVAVFYAGHGVQVDGINFLMPVDVNLTREADVPLQAVRLDDLMNAIASVPTKMRIVMLDACRNNPFTEINKTTGRGLAIVDAQAGTSNTFISYSTSPGAEAEDGKGLDSPYTTALLTAAAEPNLPIEQAFKKVRLAVNQSTEGRQLPWESSSLVSDFFFFGNLPGSKPAPDRRTADNWRGELRGKSAEAAYELVIQADTLVAYEVFAVLYPQPPFGNRVRAILERRREMMAWQDAVNLNTADAYRIFLASYPASDLAATARKLQERQRNRSLSANAALTGAAAAAAGGPANSQPPGPANSGAGNRPNVTPVSAPTCPCAQPEPPVRRASAPPPPPPRVVQPPPRVVVDRRGPPRPEPGAAQRERDRDAAIGGAIAAGVIGGIIGGAIAGGGRGGGMHPH